MNGRLVRNSFTLAAGLCLAVGLGVSRAQQPMPRPSATNMTSVYRGMANGGVPQSGITSNNAWPFIGNYNSGSGNSGYGTNNFGPSGGYASRNAAGNGFLAGYATGYANGYNNGYGNAYGGWNNGYGYGNGYGWNNNYGITSQQFGGWTLTNWPVPYAVPGATGNAYIQLPSYGTAGVINGTGFGVSQYGSYSNQFGAFGVPFARSYGAVGSFQGGGIGVGRGR